MVTIRLANGSERTGRIVQIEGERAVIQVFEGTHGIALDNTRTRLQGHPMEMPLSPETAGPHLRRRRTAGGRPGRHLPRHPARISTAPPSIRCPGSIPATTSRTGISSIDCLMTLIRGQKLPIFSGSGMKHNELAAQIVRQARIADEEGVEFAIVFAAMGVTNDVADLLPPQL